jgi:ParB family transcriptional regulator, chromosome partitioning protein
MLPQDLDDPFFREPASLHLRPLSRSPDSSCPWRRNKGSRHKLISGFRRLAAFRGQLELTGQDRYKAIPAFIRTPSTYAEAFTAMVEENEIRAELSPFEKGRICVVARETGIFGSIEEAVEALFKNSSRQKRHRIRTLALVADELREFMTAPESLSAQQCYRIAKALTAGFGELIRTALEESSITDHDHQWALIQPILAEADEVVRTGQRPRSDGRPRRILRPRYGVTIRRERTKDGWCLHFTGREASGMFMDMVLDEIERMYSPA